MQENSQQISRYEIKYFVPPQWVDKIKSFIEPYTQLDPYAVNMENNRYLVKSLYFDTPKLDFYYEKVDGLKIRKKLRLRAYNDVFPQSTGFLEIKRRYNNCVIKERTKLSLAEIEQVIDSPVNYAYEQLWGQSNHRSINRFIYNMESLDLEPAILILYDRDAFMGLDDPQVRLTIDYHVRMKYAPQVHDIYTADGLVPITDNRCILELKFNNFMPKWMRQLVQAMRIRPESISKYCMGIDMNLNTYKGLRDAGSIV